MPLIGHIAELWRYPVKSMGGERCLALDLTPHGIAGDRQFAFESADAPIGKPLLRAAQRAAMLRFRAFTDPTGRVLIHTPTGRTLCTDDLRVAAHLLRELVALDPELFLSSSSEDQRPPLALVHSPRPLTDVRPIALHSLQSLRQLAAELDAARLPGLGTGFDPRRLRSNLVLDLTSGEPFAEDALAGRTLQIGGELCDQTGFITLDPARLRITERIPRCRIVSLAPETAAHDPTLLKHLAREHNGRAGIYARPVTPGTLRVGDPVTLL